MRGWYRRILIVGLVVIALGTLAVSGRKLLKASAERRLIVQAIAQLEKKDLRSASLCLRRALQINYRSVRATRLMADAVDEVDPRAALGWRIRLAELEPGNVTNRLKWAQTALQGRDLTSAAQALAGVGEKDRESAWFHKLSGYLAYRLHNSAEAERQYLQALRLEPTNTSVQLNLCMARLASTNAAVVEDARAALEQLARNPAIRVNALHDLAAEAVAHTNLSRAAEYAGQIAAEPRAPLADKLQYLQLLKSIGSPEFGPYFSGLKTAATNSPTFAFGLARWIFAAESPTNALEWVASLPPDLVTNQPLPMIVADCHVAAKNWPALLALVQNQDWQEANSYRSALEALAFRSEGKRTLAEIAWDKALRGGVSLEALVRLVQVTTAWDWQPENKQVLQELVSRYPKEKWAGDQLMARLYQEGDTGGLIHLVTKLEQQNPEDVGLKNDLAKLQLLRKTELRKAHALAREVYLSAASNPSIVCTYAYSLLLQRKNAEALAVIRKIDSKFLNNSTVAAYYGTVQAETGHKKEARDPLVRAEAATLLPEEKEMVRLAMAKL